MKTNKYDIQIEITKNSELKQIEPIHGQVIFLPNYRIDVIVNEKDGSFSKSKIMDRRTFKDLSYFFNAPNFIKTFLNKNHKP